jgi:hypothetical protein
MYYKQNLILPFWFFYLIHIGTTYYGRPNIFVPVFEELQFFFKINLLQNRWFNVFRENTGDIWEHLYHLHIGFDLFHKAYNNVKH